MPFLHGLPTLDDARGDVLPLSQRHSSVSQHGASRWIVPANNRTASTPALGSIQHPVQGVPQTTSPKREDNVAAAGATPSSIRT